MVLIGSNPWDGVANERHGLAPLAHGWASFGTAAIGWEAALQGDGLEIADKGLFPIVSKVEEHDAVAELGVASDDASPDADRATVEPEGGMDIGGQGKSRHEGHVAAASTEIGGFEAQGKGAAFEAKINLHLHAIARMHAAVGINESEVQRLSIGRIHGIGFGPGIEERCVQIGVLETGVHLERRHLSDIEEQIACGTSTTTIGE